MLTDLRLAIRAQRTELIVLGVGGLVFVAAALVLAWRLDVVAAASPACFGSDLSQAPIPGCAAAHAEFYGLWRQIGDVLRQSIGLFPVAIGVLVGVPVVAARIEHRTALVAWGLASSRLRWLTSQAWPLVILLAIGLTLIALAGEHLARASLTEIVPGQSFVGYGERDLLVPARGLLGFAVGLAAGSVIGRVVPALLVGLVLAGALQLGLGYGINAWQWQEVEIVPLSSLAPSDAPKPTPLVLEIFDPESPASLMSTTTGFDTPDNPVATIPGQRYGLWVVRESAVTLALSMLFVGAGALVVKRRRPY